MAAFQVGDRVRARDPAGPREMKVDHCLADGQVTCSWWEGGMQLQGTFPENTLEPVPSDQPPPMFSPVA